MGAARFKLGDEVRDRITGFTGIAMNHVINLDGTEEYGVQAQKLDNGLPKKLVYVASYRLDRVGEGIPVPPPPRGPLGFTARTTSN